MILYNSQAIIPGPLLDIRRETQRTPAGKINRRMWNIQAKGKIMAWKGSPNSQGVFWTGSYSPGPPDEVIADNSRLAAMRSKMRALVNLFATQGQWFEAQPFDGTQSIKFQPRIRNISFAQGLWYDTLDYTIDMEADTIYFGGAEIGGLTTDVVPEETWNVEPADQINRTFRLTHQVTSQQTDLYASDGSIPTGNFGWQRARAIVLDHLGTQDLTKVLAPGVLNLNINYVPYNWVRNQQIDEGAGKFSVTETWLLYEAGWMQANTDTITNPIPPALDDFTISSRDTPDGLMHVTIEGTVTGLEVRDWNTNLVLASKYDNAKAYYETILNVYDNIFNRAQGFTGVLLNPIFLTRNIARNPVQGTITYNAEYSNRRLPLIPNALTEEITVQRSGGTDVFAAIPIPGRVWGPFLQGVDTITQRSITININATLPAANMLVPFAFSPNTDGVVLSFAPVALQVFKERDDSTFSSETGRYSRSVTFVYQ